MSPRAQIFNFAWHCLGRQAVERGGKTALIIADGPDNLRSWTYAELDSKVRRLAGGLVANGLRKGDRVMIRAANDVEAVIAIFAAAAIGCVAQPASLMLTAEEALALAADAGASAIVLGDADPSERALFASMRVFDRDDIVRLAAEGEPADYTPTAPDDPAYLVFTSGSTAEPKGVLHGHRVVIGRRPMADDWLGLAEDDIVLHAGNINWTYTLGVGVLDPFARGATGALYAGPRDPAIWPRLIEATGATIFAAVPSVFRQMLKYGDPSPRRLGRLRHGVTAGEALAPDLLAHWREATGTWLYEALGMSEISTYVSSRPGEPIRPGSPGRPQRGRRVAILPVEGGTDPLPPGAVGLLAVHRSDPGLMLGYWNRPEEESGRLSRRMVPRRRSRRVRRRRLRLAPGPQQRHHERLRLPGVAARGREGSGGRPRCRRRRSGGAQGFRRRLGDRGLRGPEAGESARGGDVASALRRASRGLQAPAQGRVRGRDPPHAERQGQPEAAAAARRARSRYSERSGVRRVLTFALLGPPLGLLTGLFILSALSADWAGIDSFAGAAILVMLSYAFGLAPALLTGVFDAVLAKRKADYRPALTAFFGFVAAFIPLATSLAMGFIHGPFVMLFGFVGAVPGAACSWIAGRWSGG